MGQTLEVTPIDGPLGADVSGIDLADIDDVTFQAIQEAWHKYHLLRFRGQDITDDALVAFSRRIGVLDLAPVTEAGDLHRPDLPELNVVSNVIEDGRAVGELRNDELIWHTDMSYNEAPPSASLLFAVECPPSGGDTWFCNMHRIYQTLPADLKQRIEGLHCKHDASRNSSGGLRDGFEEDYELPDYPGAVHPLVIAHPETGLPALYLGRRRNAYIVELSVEESEKLLDELWAHASKPEFAWAQEWQPHDLVMWDNRSTMHRRDAFDPSVRRIMHRTQVKGCRLS